MTKLITINSEHVFDNSSPLIVPFKKIYIIYILSKNHLHFKIMFDLIVYSALSRFQFKETIHQLPLYPYYTS